MFFRRGLFTQPPFPPLLDCIKAIREYGSTTIVSSEKKKKGRPSKPKEGQGTALTNASLGDVLFKKEPDSIVQV